MAWPFKKENNQPAIKFPYPIVDQDHVTRRLDHIDKSQQHFSEPHAILQDLMTDYEQFMSLTEQTKQAYGACDSREGSARDKALKNADKLYDQLKTREAELRRRTMSFHRRLDPAIRTL